MWVTKNITSEGWLSRKGITYSCLMSICLLPVQNYLNKIYIYHFIRTLNNVQVYKIFECNQVIKKKKKKKMTYLINVDIIEETKKPFIPVLPSDVPDDIMNIDCSKVQIMFNVETKYGFCPMLCIKTGVEAELTNWAKQVGRSMIYRMTNDCLVR